MVAQQTDEYPADGALQKCTSARSTSWRSGMAFPTIAKPSELLSAQRDMADVGEKERWVNELLRPLCGMETRKADFLQRHHPYFTSTGLKEWVEHGHSIGLHTDTHVFCDKVERRGNSVRDRGNLKAQSAEELSLISTGCHSRIPSGNHIKAETA